MSKTVKVDRQAQGGGADDETTPTGRPLANNTTNRPSSLERGLVVLHPWQVDDVRKSRKRKKEEKCIIRTPATYHVVVLKYNYCVVLRRYAGVHGPLDSQQWQELDLGRRFLPPINPVTGAPRFSCGFQEIKKIIKGKETRGRAAVDQEWLDESRSLPL